MLQKIIVVVFLCIVLMSHNTDFKTLRLWFEDDWVIVLIKSNISWQGENRANIELLSDMSKVIITYFRSRLTSRQVNFHNISLNPHQKSVGSDEEMLVKINWVRQMLIKTSYGNPYKWGGLSYLIIWLFEAILPIWLFPVLFPYFVPSPVNLPFFYSILCCIAKNNLNKNRTK